MNILPDKIGDLIRIAVKDLTLCEANPTYMINMDEWHTPNTDASRCCVCLAGAVMAQTLKLNPQEEYKDGRFGSEDKKLRLLEILRWVVSNLECFESHHSDKLSGVRDLIDSGELFDATPYKKDPGQFKTDMLALAGLMDRHDVHYIGG